MDERKYRLKVVKGYCLAGLVFGAAGLIFYLVYMIGKYGQFFLTCIYQ
ncbi:MAG: hypothetical protein K6G10_01390 [Butyrivibrio sp.]|nr:hypothetical protein [Butyrivibrio sp.]